MTQTASVQNVNKNLAGRYAHVDALRALAVMAVVVQHAGLSMSPGPSGVTVFFAISGFIITTITLREFEKTGTFSSAGFYVRRAFKIFPPFAVAILVPTLIYGIFHPLNWWAVAAQVFFGYNWVQVADYAASEQVLPGSEVVWSLAVEEQFYIVFALLWLWFIQLKNPRRALIVLTVVTITYATVARFLLLEDGDIRIARATDTRLDSIAWGVLAAVLLSYFRGGGAQWLARLGRDWAFYAAGALLLISFAPLGDAFELTMRYSLQSIATVLLILYGMLIEGKMSTTKSVMLRFSAWRPIAIIGLASYSIYLAHSVFKALTSPLIEGLLPRPVEILLYTVAGALVGIALWQWVEKPSLKARHRFTRY